MENRGTRFYIALLVFVAVGLLAAGSVLWERHGREAQNNTAVMLSDYRALSDYSRQQGIPIDEVLKKVKKQGVSALAVDEMDRDELLARGLARILNSYEIADLQYQGRVSNSFTPKAECVYVVAANDSITTAIFDSSVECLGEKRVDLIDSANHVVAIESDMRQVAVMGFGIPADTVDALVNQYGFHVWVRPWNSPFYNSASLRHVIKKLARPGVDGVIFGGLRNEVLGFPNDLEMVGEELAKANLRIGVIELPRANQQKGIETLARDWPQNVVRVQSISIAHQAKVDPRSVAAMYGLGARERNIRLLYVRPYYDGYAKLNAREATDLLFTTISTDLKDRLGSEPTVFAQDVDTSRGLNGYNFRLLFIALGIASGLCAWVRTISGWSSRPGMVILLLTLIITAATICTGIGLRYWRLLLGLGGLMVFPIWGMSLLCPVWEKYSTSTCLGRTIYAGWKVMFIAAGFAVAGGLMGASCLPDTVYMLSIDVFRGVKLHSLMVPFLVLLCWVIFQNRRGALTWVRDLLNEPVRFWHLAVFVILLGAMAFYIIRTGNSGGDMVVSDGERELRRWLDMVLGVRPRFKEFVLGNPVLICIPTLMMCRWRGAMPFAVLFAALGAASIAGTYAHLHTPLVISLWRTVMGLIVGGIFGTILAIIVYAIQRAYLRYCKPWLEKQELILNS